MTLRYGGFSKEITAGGAHVLLVSVLIVYTIFTLGFGWLLFGTNGIPKIGTTRSNEQP